MLGTSPLLRLIFRNSLINRAGSNISGNVGGEGEALIEIKAEGNEARQFSGIEFVKIQEFMQNKITFKGGWVYTQHAFKVGPQLSTHYCLF